MKKTGCALSGCAVVVGLLALAALAVLRLSAPEPAPAPPPRAEEPSEPPEAGPPKALDPDAFLLTFRFRDADDRPRRFTCAIRRSDVERERAGFGYVEAQKVEEMNRELRELLAREAEARGVARYFKVEVYGEGSYRWSWSYPGGTDPEVVERIEAFHAWLDKDSSAAVHELEDRYYRAHGMRLDGDTIHIDYATLVDHATQPLADCFAALRGLGGRSGAPIGLFLPFLQELRYELPKDVDEDGRETLGFRVPTAVLVEGAGDCDSKAAVFCSLWRQLPGRVLLVLVPGHALVAVEGKPGPDQAAIRLGNRYFILCEVAGPGRFRPGETDVSGSFEYVLIEPVRG